MTGRLEAKSAIVTGGLRGIGRATANLFLTEGASVCVFDLEPAGSDAWQALQKAVGSRFDRLAYQQVDATAEADVARGVEAVLATQGRIDILVNNIGKGLDPKPIEELSLAEWDATVRINLTTAFLCTRAVIGPMKRQGQGKIVNVSSQAGRSKSEVSNLPYASAKAALLGFTRNLAFELGPFGITVNAVAPGVTLTDRIHGKLAHRSDVDELTKAVPLRRFGVPTDIAAAILYLASPDADYVTGATIDVNGGRTMM